MIFMTVFSRYLFAVLAILFFVSSNLQATTANVPHWVSDSDAQEFTIALFPRDGEIPLNRYHQWVVSVRDKQNRPVPTAHLKLVANMPGHGHGMPSKPEVTSYLENGKYLVEGMRFNMTGSWVIRVMVQTAFATDDAVFEIELEHGR